ncbi:flavodoxin family protein [Nitratidesulfovibrio vulgaris]|jgi:multimeric flavodoxin WrbA|uniref:FMN reductase, NADPH-dependent n=1 Tax=Nitratidesulfovibrio vulgaris (strain ATCC 29579 / DSM 644 / CCUG 34227 / NCIMB 8303 / VKM B-1760 / Hildenborough) TaxID=882 RepID=Q72DW0_NITV2|nr:flavodoxin family protein [Nitratidesulfovibrio vulgaris]GEB81346.1 FMN reductase [Desulfovibrio desulfuricans]HBW14808.1 flavodoxin family protein [Desulfovibrio sp.]AAS95299.1 FMN reductase, NADPH-dependent [Nitratidesulfovibrio vulgaris str. Hildenborough]ADP85917.1 NADPH-dependent FMN reductase [Nitratidesulfovibrio vulgaris RCH1]WCB47472.1 flavodoxin family protein [Nitratidesulfovibrio vulgaris]
MYALAINGSPRKGGNTEIMLNKALEPLAAAGWETELVQVGGRNIRGCIACYKCFENKDGRCAVTKDKFNDVMEKMLRADALILGSPTYFTDVTAELKAVLDRSGLVAIANGTAFRGKIGAAVVVARRGGATHVYDTINHMFLMSQMLVPGSIYWNLGYGRDKGEVESDAEAMANMDHLGKVIDWLGKATAPHRDAYPLGVRPPAE